jgi:hypothetical protein
MSDKIVSLESRRFDVDWKTACQIGDALIDRLETENSAVWELTIGIIVGEYLSQFPSNSWTEIFDDLREEALENAKIIDEVRNENKPEPG